MLSATRRSLLSSPSPRSHPSLRLAFAASHDSTPPYAALHTTPALFDSPMQRRASKAKRLERDDKLRRKRELRAVRRERDVERLDRAREREHMRRDEVREKQAVAEEIADALPPLTDDQLSSIYAGLISATPAELAAPFAALPPVEAAPALPDPAVEARERGERLTLLEERLREMELEEEDGEREEVEERKEAGESLAERLRARRAVDSGAAEADASPVEAAGAVEAAEDAAARVPAVATSPARAVLERLEALHPSETEMSPAVPQGEGALEGSAELPRGLLARDEWEDVVLACAEDGDRDGVFKALKMMDQSTPISEGKVLEDVLALYSQEGRTQDALALAGFARQNSLPLSVTAHHHLLTSLLPSHPELALRHLHSMEASGHTPLPTTYTAVTSRLLSPSSAPHLVRAGWDLFAHSRAVAYPIPSPELYSAVLVACGSGAHPAPERAIDLFTEMTHDNRLPAGEAAYSGVIRACAREGSSEYYAEALRFLQRMLDENVRPSRRTFHAVLEGARRHGDLARARWMLVRMVGAGGDAAPDATTLALVLQAYAAFRPEVRERRAEQAAVVAPSGVAEKGNESSAALEVKDADEQVRARPSATLEPEQDPATLPLSTSAAGDETATTPIVGMLGEDALEYPGPMPTFAAEVVAEAKNLMLQVVHAAVLSPDATAGSSSSPPAPPPSSMFPAVIPSTFLLNAYLSVLHAHAPLPTSLAFFHTAFAALSLPKNRHTFEMTMRRLEGAKNRDKSVEEAKKVFEEWLGWREEKFPGLEEEASEGAEEGKETQVDRTEVERWVKDRTDGKNAGRMWGGLIRVLARAHDEDEALRVLKRFVSLYPPTSLARGITLPSLDPPRQSSSSPSPHLPPLPIKLASSLYPETSPSLDALRTPHLGFKDLEVLHLRLANKEDRDGLRYVKWVVSAYEGNVREGRRKERRRER
ncbi:hypothetical protein JCM10207_006140 [Rhodosporidiobolus poonsookiae]